MSLAARLDEMIILYTLDGFPISQIAGRFNCTAETVRMMLIGAGVELRARGGGNPSLKDAPAVRPTTPPIRPPAPVRQIDPETYEASAFAEGDRAHVRAVWAALRGRGFPFYNFRSAA